jgi:signal transduction histidine kinase
VMSMLDPQARQRGVSVRVDVPDGLPPISGDSRLLTIMVRNLLSNAIKYSLEGGVVDVAARAEGDNFVLSVVDRGLGIAEQDLPHIFDKFTRLQAARAAGVSGTGLGLAMVKQAVDAHGGTITVTSRPQAGSLFAVTIPFSGAASMGLGSLRESASPEAEWGEAGGTSGDWTGGQMQHEASYFDGAMEEEEMPSPGQRSPV